MIEVRMTIQATKNGAVALTLVPYLEGVRKRQEEIVFLHFHTFFKKYEERMNQKMRMPDMDEVREQIDRLNKDSGETFESPIDITDDLTTGG
ncbi:MAG: hypothetical protein EOM20_14680 [Spartobacteria bacterium]|nr:hypothetical protein [Spartobacteria bacterium]